MLPFLAKGSQKNVHLHLTCQIQRRTGCEYNSNWQNWQRMFIPHQVHLRETGRRKVVLATGESKIIVHRSVLIVSTTEKQKRKFESWQQQEDTFAVHSVFLPIKPVMLTLLSMMTVLSFPEMKTEFLSFR